MRSLGLERSAQGIANNVVSAFERTGDGAAGAMGFRGPRVAAVDLADGFVTLREA